MLGVKTASSIELANAHMDVDFSNEYHHVRIKDHITGLQIYI